MRVYPSPHIPRLFVAIIAGAWLASPGLAQAETRTFGAANAEQVFTVPAGVTVVHVVAVGARGGAGPDGGASGGFGATATADVSVTPGEVLYIEVGGNGSDGCCTKGMGPGPGGSGGFNGGAVGGTGGPGAGGGGGASDVRTSPMSSPSSLSSRVVIAGGGGGGGAPASGTGGVGGAGGSPGGQGGGDTTAAGPGTSAGGGAGGTNTNNAGLSGSKGSLGSGGAGGSVGPGAAGGGGGGGVYGGGGGAASQSNGGSGGGGGGAGGSSGFGAGVINGTIRADSTGVSSVTLSYTPQTTGGGGLANPALAAVSGLSLSHKSFAAEASGPSATAKKVPRGTDVRFDLNEAASVRFTVSKRVKGRKVKRRKRTVCAKPTRKNRRKRRCARVVKLKGSFTRDGVAGRNSFHFTGRLNGKKLKPGRYRLVARPRAGGRTGKPTSTGFRIVR